MIARVLVLCIVLLTSLSHCQEELLQNPDFEQPLGAHWFCSGCQFERSTDAYTGQYSAKVTERNAHWAALSQYVNVQAGKQYYFRAMVKFVNQLPGFLYHQISVVLEVDYVDGEKQYKGLGSNPHMDVSHGWQVLGGDVSFGEKEVQRVRLYFPVPEEGVGYLVDSASLTEVTPNPSWLEEANARIEQLRKTDITFALNISSSYNPANIELDVALTRHAVPFGSAINSNRIVGDSVANTRYQQFFYDNFEYSVIENALKWRAMEPTEGDIYLETPRNAINALQNKGIPVRGHCVYWEKEEQVPDWMRQMTGEQIRAQISRRADYVVNAFKGSLIHWDVNNEDLHGTFFKTATEDNSIIRTMFSEVHKHDPDAKLFLNEYGVVSYSNANHAYLNQANRLKAAGVPIHGVGVQAHLSGFISPELYLKRLDSIAESGLPIWITELTYASEDRDIRADGYETALRLFYSHPGVEGILLWGFWDGAHYKKDAALVEGENFLVNAAGLRYQSLVKGEWYTSATLLPTSSTQELSLRGFQGSYNVTVKYKGSVIKVMTVDVPNKSKTQRFEVTI